MSASIRSIVCESLAVEHLVGVLSSQYLVVVVKQFVAPQSCIRAAEKINRDATAAKSVSDIYTTHFIPFYNAASKPELLNAYFEDAVPRMREIRSLFAPELSPIDRLRLELDELWNGGAQLSRIDGRTMLFGLPRVWSSGSQAIPHQDVLRREVPNSAFAARQLTQLGANVYLACSEGGDLEVWDRVFEDHEVEELGVKGSYGFDRSMLGEPAARVTPEVGDLVLLNTCHVHAITEITKGTRITISGFVGGSGDESPLLMWS